MNTRCAIYARYSSENQREASIADQVRVCECHAEREGWHVAARLQDQAVSGATVLRAGYQALQELVRARAVDIVLAESLDRLSRDQEHIAALFKLARFSDVRIVTVAEGEIGELHVGLKGTMGALYLRDLADKTRRGLEGRVRQGRSGGGLSFGYRIVRGPMTTDGTVERGLREIDASQAAVVRRIFQEFADGHSPIAIARRLNVEGVPGPRGKLWSDGTIRGFGRTSTGILRNTLYIGEVVWNRRRWIKDPATGRRVARRNDAGQLVRTKLPELRIIDDALWQRVQERLDQASRPQDSQGSGPGRHRRPVHLISGKVFCGVCGSRYEAVGKDYLACHRAAKQGACSNAVRPRRSVLETQVMEALATQLMDPALVAEFARAFMAEWNHRAGERAAEARLRKRDLQTIERKIAGLVEAIADGLRAPGLQARLDELERCRRDLSEACAMPEAVPPRFHGNLAELYRTRVERLRAGLANGEGPEVLEAARALVARIEISPGDAGAPRIELMGELSALLAAGGVALPRSAESSAVVVAGTGFEPVTFRL